LRAKGSLAGSPCLAVTYFLEFVLVLEILRKIDYEDEAEADDDQAEAAPRTITIASSLT